MEVDISGAKVFFTIPIDFPLFGKIQISETLVVSWIVMALITGLCIWLTRDLKVRNISKRQAVAEMIVETANKFVIGNMGEKFRYLIPFVSALFATSVVSNLISLIGMACRHFGNILSGVVINALIYGSLALASGKLLGLLPGVLGRTLSQIPILDVGVPAVLSVYFDWFSGVMQAFIFCMLTVMYIANAAEEG